MTTVDRPNRQKLNEGIDIFRDKMRSFLSHHLKQIRGTNIEMVVESILMRKESRLEDFRRHINSGGTVQGFLDVGDSWYLINGHWDNYFKHHFKNDRTILEGCKVVTRARNQSYHIDEHDTNTTEAKYTLLQIAGALNLINCPEEARQVQLLHDAIVDPQIGELREEIARLQLSVKDQNSQLEMIANSLDRFDGLMELVSSYMEDLLNGDDGVSIDFEERISRLEENLAGIPRIVHLKEGDREGWRDNPEDQRFLENKGALISKPTRRDIIKRELSLFEGARYYCTVEICSFSDGSRRSWYNEHKARDHEEQTGHKVRNLDK